MGGIGRWVNAERGVFLAAALWLLVTGVRFQKAPVIERWGPPRVLDSPPDRRPVSLAPPPPIAEFLAGGRANPFADDERRAAFDPRPFRSWRPPTPAEPRPTPAAPAAPVEPPKLPPKPPAAPPKPAPPEPTAKPKAYDLPVRLAGRVEVGGADGRTIFVVKEDGKYVAVKEGEELPGLGVKVVRATKNVVIVENEKGQRFRLNDLLRAKAAGGGGE